MTTRYVDPAAGGANNGTSWTDAWTSLQSAADTAVAGDVVYCRGTQLLSAAIDFDTNSGSAAGGYIKFIGCNAGGTIDGTYFTLNGQSNAIHCVYINGMDWVWLENFEIINAGATSYDGITVAASNADNWVLNHVRLASNGRNGLYSNAYFKLACCFRCEVELNGGRGIYKLGSSSSVVLTSVIDNSGRGMEQGLAFAGFFGNVLHSNVTDELYKWGSELIVNSVIDGGSVDGIELAGTGAYLLLGCRITNCVTNGVNVAAANRALLAGCYFGGNGTDITGTYDILPINGSTAHVTLAGADSDHGYADSANDDFNVVDGATLDSFAIALP